LENRECASTAWSGSIFHARSGAAIHQRLAAPMNAPSGELPIFQAFRDFI